ncbi:MAG: DUF58 domain-containing protein [Polyangiaceae bacterium]|nr:DUF58 domain-containing protein [Polyangiaceae bacterium]
MSADALLDPAFVRELEVLRRRLEVRVRSGAAGEHAARRRGGSAEFQEHRPYAPGDDLRRVDWLAFARSGQPMLKLFRQEEDVVVRLLVDASASLGHGEPPKIVAARRLAAAIAYMALARSERAQVVVARQTDGRALAKVGPPRRGRAGLPAVLAELAAAPAEGTADLARAVEQVVVTAARPGMLVVLSDFLDAGPVLAALGRAAAAGHDVALVHVLSREELEPNLEGDCALVDAETGAVVEATLDPAALEAYARRLAGLCDELAAWARRHRATSVRVTTDEPLEAALRRFVARAVE